MAGRKGFHRKGQPRTGGKGSGSGRTSGSFTLAKTTMKELMARFPNPDHPITVGTKWAIANAVPITTGEAAKITSQTAKALASETEMGQFVEL
jgi:hypothetical protein